MVFKVDQNFKVILNMDAVRLVPELAAVSEKELLYIILAYDYTDGPFRRKPFEERRSLAIKRIFGDDTVNLETKKINVAAEAYKSLIFDVRRETRDVYLKKIQMYQRELLAINLEFKRAKELDQMIQYFEERVSSIDKSLESDDIANIKLKGGKELSYIEIWQVRQQEYRKFKQST